MLSTGTGNDLQADNDFLVYMNYLLLCRGNLRGHSTRLLSVPPSAHLTLAIGLLITSRALLPDSLLLARVIALTTHKGTFGSTPYSPARCAAENRAIGVHPSVHRQ